MKPLPDRLYRRRFPAEIASHGGRLCHDATSSPRVSLAACRATSHSRVTHMATWSNSGMLRPRPDRRAAHTPT